jgi:alpha-ketoglutarate-dependent taurine dioxygenase
VIPPVGGDTVWVNTVAAYETLPPVLRGLADQLWALHTNAYDYGATRPNANRRSPLPSMTLDRRAREPIRLCVPAYEAVKTRIVCHERG